MKRVLIFATIVCLSATFGIATQVAPVFAAEDIEQMLANAKTAADHEAIAAYYTREAEAFRQKADQHRRMLGIVKKQGGPGIAKWHMDEHCADFVKDFQDAAMRYDELAQAHRDMAKGVK